MAWSALSPLAATRHLLLLECLIKHLEKGLDMASNLLLCLRLAADCGVTKRAQVVIRQLAIQAMWIQLHSIALRYFLEANLHCH